MTKRVSFVAGGAGVVAGLLVALIVAIAPGVLPREVAGAADGRSLHVKAYTSISAGKAGETCDPFGGVETGRDIEPWRQVIITNDVGAVVGVMDLEQGAAATETVDMLGPDGKATTRDFLNCVVTADLSIPDAPFYTFTVDGAYKLTVSRDTLEANDWKHEVYMGSAS